VYAGLGCGASSWAGAEPRARFMGVVLWELRKPERWQGRALASLPVNDGATYQTPRPQCSTTVHTWCTLSYPSAA
jgi:hypothetical protein